MRNFLVLSLNFVKKLTLILPFRGNTFVILSYTHFSVLRSCIVCIFNEIFGVKRVDSCARD